MQFVAFIGHSAMPLNNMAVSRERPPGRFSFVRHPFRFYQSSGPPCKCDDCNGMWNVRLHFAVVDIHSPTTLCGCSFHPIYAASISTISFLRTPVRVALPTKILSFSRLESCIAISESKLSNDESDAPALPSGGTPGCCGTNSLMGV